MHPKQLFELGKKAVTAWSADFAPSMGAAISYYTVFSLAPLLVIVIAVAGALFGREAVQGQIVGQLSDFIGRDAAMAVQGLIKSASEPSKGLVAGLIGAGILILGATTVLAELQSALDRIWHVPASAKPKGAWSVLRARLLSFGLIMTLAFLLMVSLVVATAVAAFGSWAGGYLPGWAVLLQVLNIAVSMGITTLLFAMIFKFMPTVLIAWRDVWIGAAVTAVLFEVGKFGIGLYLGKSGMNESYAAAGSLVVLLVWVYYAAQIFLLGAEFTKVYASEYGSMASRRAAAAVQQQAAAALPLAGGAGVAAEVGEPAAAADVPDYAALARTAAMQDEIDRRVQQAAQGVLKQLLVLGAATFASAVVSGWQKRQRRSARATRKAHKAQRRSLSA